MSQEIKIIQLKDKNDVKLWPTIQSDSIPDGIIGKEKLDDGVKQKIDGIVITLNYGDSGEIVVGESSLSSSSAIKTYYSAYEKGVNIYFVISSGMNSHTFTTSNINYLPVYEFSRRSESAGPDTRDSYTLKAMDDVFIYTANSIDERPYLTVTRSAITAEPNDFSVTTTKLTDKSVTKDKLSDDIVQKLDSSVTDANVQQLQTAITTLNGDKTVVGSVDKKVSDAISNLVGSAPDTLNTLQKIAEEMQNPANNTATTVLDQVASKADSSALTEEITRAKAAEQANATNIATNTSSIQSLQYNKKFLAKGDINGLDYTPISFDPHSDYTTVTVPPNRRMYYYDSKAESSGKPEYSMGVQGNVIFNLDLPKNYDTSTPAVYIASNTVSYHIELWEYMSDRRIRFPEHIEFQITPISTYSYNGGSTEDSALQPEVNANRDYTEITVKRGEENTYSGNYHMIIDIFFNGKYYLGTIRVIPMVDSQMPKNSKIEFVFVNDGGSYSDIVPSSGTIGDNGLLYTNKAGEFTYTYKGTKYTPGITIDQYNPINRVIVIKN